MAKKQRPQTMTIQGETIKIVYKDLSDDGNLGSCHCSNRLIKIEETLQGRELNRVIAHEVMHMKLRLSGLYNFMPYKLEEALCEMMENGLGSNIVYEDVD